MKKSFKPHFGFTLVELIIVISILSILTTIAFFSFNNYTSNTKDVKVISDLNAISKSLDIFQVKTGTLPLPKNYLTISNSGDIINYQGNLDTSILNNLHISNDDNIFTYSTNAKKDKYQLFSYLNGTSISSSFSVNADFKYGTEVGSDLGLVFDSNYNALNLSQTGIDIQTSTGNYIVVLNNQNINYGSTEALKSISPTLSCKRYKELGYNTDGVYDISPDFGNTFKVYCDMNTDGGGWTLILKADGTKSTFTYSSTLWTSGSILNPENTSLDQNEYKSDAYNRLGFDNVKLVFQTGSFSKTLNFKKSYSSMKDLLNSGIYDKTYTGTLLKISDINRAGWLGVIPNGGTLDAGCNQSGINNKISRVNIRIGILGDQGVCDTPDSAIGFGINSSYTVGNRVGTTFPQLVFGYIFVR